VQSYPQRLQDILEQSAVAKRTIVEHEFFHSMSEGAIPARAMGRFLTGVRPVIEQFPQYMAMNLLKVQSGESPAHELGRRYLIRNIRVEQNHVEY
jgi:pyrroloquinoline quinone (PQQ) biosynthesis protein C